MAAGRARIGAVLADGAGLGGQGHDVLDVRLQNGERLARDGLVRRAGGERLFEVRNVGNFGQRGQVERMRIGKAARTALLHCPDRGRTGPRLAVHGAFLLADAADALRKFQLCRLDPAVLGQRKGGELLLDQFPVQMAHLTKSLTRFYTMRAAASMGAKKNQWQASCTVLP